MNCLLRFCSLNWMTHIVVNVIEKETNKSHHFNLFEISVNGEGLEMEKFIGSVERFQRVMYTAINWPHLNLNMRFFYLRWLAFGIHTKKMLLIMVLKCLRTWLHSVTERWIRLEYFKWGKMLSICITNPHMKFMND